MRQKNDMLIELSQEDKNSINVIEKLESECNYLRNQLEK